MFRRSHVSQLLGECLFGKLELLFELEQGLI